MSSAAICTVNGGYSYTRGVNESIGYAKCSPDTQNRTGQRSILLGLGSKGRIYSSRATVHRMPERAPDMNAGVR
ncbi:hypothetical protein GCM10010347_42990 [Streptomyces cirratus]|uniref:Uncharacterized protein n=1 Tax=Streptomyces cirratus TaxID=68187 RepID=A0ABQ3F0T6_9ACTN|nr:hypothetical protein GCM10010347_42990 [Streptomyces cirratus]